MKPLNFEADVLSGMDDLREQFPTVPTKTRILPSGDIERLDAGTLLDDPLFPYQQTNHGNSLAKAAERSELRKTLLGDDFDDLPAPATRPLSTSQSIAQIIGKAVDGVFDKVQHISTSAKAREQRINQILNETKGQLLAKGYDAAESWDGWPKLAQTCDSTIVALLMEA